MLFYFTATGNSLYVAKHLEKKPISIAQAVHDTVKTYTADRIGIVCPVFGHEVPALVREFLEQSVFETPYFYMILTYGNRHGGAVELAEKLCRECGITPAYINVLLMVDNWLPSFDMNEQRSIDKKVEEHLAGIRADIQARKIWMAPVTDTDRAAHQQFLGFKNSQPADAWQHLIRVTESCVGCGICAKVCPSGSIQVVEGKAVHTPGNCQTCLACVHACPKKAIGLNIPEKNPNARYRNEHISLQEIIEANEQ